MEHKNRSKKEYAFIALCLLLVIGIAVGLGTVFGKYTQAKDGNPNLGLTVETVDTSPLDTVTASDEGYESVEFIFPIGEPEP